MKDLILASISNYTYDKVKCWLNSLKQSGFDGDIIMVCLDVDEDTAIKIHEQGVDVYYGSLEANQHIVVERFYYYWSILSELKEKYRFVICTDVSDVIFQRDPSRWLDFNVRYECIIASSESIKYKDEVWGYHNIRNTFGERIGNELNDNIICNAGVIAGRPKKLEQLFKLIYFMCDNRPSQVIGGGGPDQAAYNIALTNSLFEDDLFFVPSEMGWAAQLGTTGDPHKLPRYEPLLVEPKPIFKDGMVCTSNGEPFYIVHQYNRVPEIKAAFEAKYGC